MPYNLLSASAKLGALLPSASSRLLNLSRQLGFFAPLSWHKHFALSTPLRSTRSHATAKLVLAFLGLRTPHSIPELWPWFLSSRVWLISILLTFPFFGGRWGHQNSLSSHEVGGRATKKCAGCCWPTRGRVELSTTSLEKGFFNKPIKEQGINASRHFVGLLRVHVKQYVLFIIRSKVRMQGDSGKCHTLASAFYVWGRKGEDLFGSSLSCFSPL